MQAIDYPSVELGGKTYYLRMSIASMRRLKEFGAVHPPVDTGDHLTDQIAKAEWVATHLAAFAHVPSGNNGDLVAAGMTVATAEDIMELQDCPIVEKALGEAVEKARRVASSPAPLAEQS